MRGVGLQTYTYYHTHNGVLVEEQKGEAGRIHVWIDSELFNINHPKDPNDPTLRYSLRWAMAHYTIEQQTGGSFASDGTYK